MKAWHVQEKDGDHQEIIFAETRADAITQSEARGWADYIDIRANHAPYADGLEECPEQLKVAQLENGWWFACSGEKCNRQVTNEETYAVNGNRVLCAECTDKTKELSTAQRLMKHLDENGQAYYEDIAKKNK